ncbi:MAG TPA: hypothetical protein VM597_34940 [Gemmataceae bacterium]|jgi:hypothetical protein|nr:hypothetical protein [Gemmataceae bacterium]
MMTPTQYMRQYMNMGVILDNWEIAEVKNDRYRNNGIASTRSPDADKMKDLINWCVAHESKNRIIEGVSISPLRVYDAFIGKSSPEDTHTVIWLAHRYGFIANPNKPKPPGGYKALPSAQAFCDKYTGLDCNGFVANYYGMARSEPHYIGSFAPKNLRLKRPEDVAARCSLCFFKGGADSHIAVVETASIVGETLKMKIVQSSGMTYGLNTKDWDVAIPANLKKPPVKQWTLGSDPSGHIYFLDSIGRATYPCLPRTDKAPNP